MRLKIFQFNNPKTKQIEEVYEYPWTYYYDSSYGRTNLYTREPMKFPILVIPKQFIKEISNQRWTIDNNYLDLTYYYGVIDGKYN